MSTSWAWPMKTGTPSYWRELVVVRRMEGGAFRGDYELMEVAGVTGAYDLADLLVGVVGEDVMADAVGVDDRALEPRQGRLAVVRLDAEVERDLVLAR